MADTAHWLSVEQAWQRLEAAVPQIELERESVELPTAGGRVLAANIQSPIDMPPADRSTMDGIALCHAQAEAGRALPISQHLPAGQPPALLHPGTAARIFTGAPVPPGADTVIAQEDCVFAADQVRVRCLPECGSHIRRRGADMATGQTLLSAGHRLRPQDLGLLAAAGVAQVEVLRRLRVALVVTGDELVPPGQRLSAGKIYESNAPMLAELIRGFGGAPDCFYCADDLQQTVDTLDKAASASDLVLSIGGASVGDSDHIRAALQRLGKLDFWRIAIKPGKPFLCGNLGEVPLLGLPGNPVSAWLACCLFCQPFIRKLQGGPFTRPRTWPARAAFSLVKTSPRQQYLRGILVDAAGSCTPEVKLLPEQVSSALSSLCAAEVLVAIPPQTAIRKGQVVDVVLVGELVG
ncbi:MAG: molybdopterin molybdotransferase MoeA [Cellvibrionales bacterium]|nr:molybdopterin molybdotransferase MoeA [Cellvibrionales bacterium]